MGVFAFFLDWHHRLPSLLWQGSLSVCTFSPCVPWCFVCSGTSVGNYSSFLRCQRPEDCVIRFDLFFFNVWITSEKWNIGRKNNYLYNEVCSGCFSGYHLQVQVFDAGDSCMCSHDCRLLYIKSSKYFPAIDRHVNPDCWFYDHHV